MDAGQLRSETTPLLAVPRTGLSRASSTTTCSQATDGSSSPPPRGPVWVWRVPGKVSNTGSTARDMLAAERNFLSWLRLSLGAMGTGAVALADIAQLHSPLRNGGGGGGAMRRFLEDYDDVIGLLLFSLSAFALVAALIVYGHVAAQLAVARRPLRWTATLLVSTVGAVAATVLIVALTVGHRRPETLRLIP
ncbi:hypothetical protein H4R19_003621 [Coemansia spiralis]|nr:hypothetical protein H4R19_003621 [Coemansia spiralis]